MQVAIGSQNHPNVHKTNYSGERPIYYFLLQRIVSKRIKLLNAGREQVTAPKIYHFVRLVIFRFQQLCYVKLKTD